MWTASMHPGWARPLGVPASMDGRLVAGGCSLEPWRASCWSPLLQGWEMISQVCMPERFQICVLQGSMLAQEICMPPQI